MPLHLKFSNDLDRLARRLAREPAADTDPFTQEIIVVSGTGLRRWLSFRLAEYRGVCANCRFPTTQTFIQQLLGLALDQQESAAFTKESMAWQIFAWLQDSSPPELAVPARYIAGKPQQAALQLAQRVAELFDQYLTYRPDWILAWESNRFIGTDPAGPDSAEAWQRHLWQRLCQSASPHRGHLYSHLIERLEAGAVPGLARKVSVFGTHTLPPVFLKILAALGTHHEVDLSIVQPTPQFWGDHPGRQLLKPQKAQLATEFSPHGGQPGWGNDLVAAWGGQGRDLFNILIDADIYTSEQDDATLFSEPPAKSLLGALQRSIYHLQDHVDWLAEAPEDDSLRVHCCHHPMREVEILQDCLLQFLAADSSLRPDEILVLTPDIETYAPIVEAIFGNPERGQPRLPFSIADRTFRNESRCVDTLFKIIDVCRGRFAASEVFGLLQAPPMRARFAWGDEELSRIREWLMDMHTAWGRDAAHRNSMGLPGLRDYTWEAAIERLMLGCAIRPEQPQKLADGTPFDAVEGADCSLVGQLAEAIGHLGAAAEAIAQPRSPAEWAILLEQQILEIFFAQEDADAFEMRQIRQALERLRETAGRVQTPVEAATLAEWLESSIQDGLPSRGFLGKGITFAALTPMRAIPHRVVCLLGMNDTTFPRPPRNLGFDLMRMRGLGRAGDRSSSQSDRYLFLETVLSARDKLHISYSGFSPRDDAVKPPSSTVDELLRFLTKGLPQPQAKHRQKHVCRNHHLHGHHPEYFRIDSPSGLFSFSQAKCAAALAGLSRIQEADPPAAIGGLKPGLQRATQVTLDQLVNCFKDPARYFCENALGMKLPRKERVFSDGEPLVLDSLTRYQLLDESIADPNRAASICLGDHAGPPGTFGKLLAAGIAREAENLRTLFKEPCPEIVLPEEPPCILNWEAADRTRLTGSISGIRGGRLVRWRAGRIRPVDQVAWMIEHVALCAAGYELNAPTCLLGTTGKDSKISAIVQSLTLLDPANAQALLNEWICLFHEAGMAPLPFEPASSSAVLAQSGSDRRLGAARRAWVGSEWESRTPASRQPHTLLCWGDKPPFEPPRMERFFHLASRIFTGSLGLAGQEESDEEAEA